MKESNLHSIEVLASNGNIEELKKLFEFKYTQSEIDAALENAIAYSQIQTAEYLLLLGATLSSNDYNGVYYAVHNNELEGLKFAISKGVDININYGMLLNVGIETAINTKNVRLVKWLLTNGANPILLTKTSLELVDQWGNAELKAVIKDAQNQQKVTIIESWKLSVGNQILADIRHSLNGLNSGTVLKSEATGLTWKVVSRIIYQQSENQKRFSNEIEHFLHFSFRPVENLEKFRQDIHRKEASGIYQYAIQPIDHEKKPENGEPLFVQQTVSVNN